ncbi:NAD(P)H-binding protein [Acidobacteriota bacterium]
MNILLTGATGYIGRNLGLRLLEKPDLCLRLLVRDASRIPDFLQNRTEIAVGDTLQPDSLQKALDGIDTAYYLIHSMGGKGDFEDKDRMSARNFRDACINAGVKRIIYLGGLGKKETASKHLLSRIETGEILSERADNIQTIWFRAGIIIGSASASFQIIRHLIRKLPVMTTPRWVRTKTSPIGVDNVLDYLIEAIDLENDQNQIIDIGTDSMSFKDMLIRASKVMGRKTWLIPIPLLSPRLSSYWLLFITPVSFRIAKALVDGLKSETVKTNHNAGLFFSHIEPISFEEAVERAVA